MKPLSMKQQPPQRWGGKASTRWPPALGGSKLEEPFGITTRHHQAWPRETLRSLPIYYKQQTVTQGDTESPKRQTQNIKAASEHLALVCLHVFHSCTVSISYLMTTVTSKILKALSPSYPPNTDSPLKLQTERTMSN